MAAYEIVALDTATPQLRAPGASDTYSVPRNLEIADAKDVVLATTTGTKVGTGTTQKLAFWNATPIVQPANSTAIDTLLVNTGLRASGGTANFATAVTAPNLATGRTLGRAFTPLDNQPPASNFATLDTRNSIAVLDFDAATDEAAVFVGTIPQSATLTSGIKVIISWAATSATSGDCVWGVQFEKTTGQDIDSDSFDTATTGTTTTSGTSGVVNTTTITATTIDSLAAGDCFRIKVYRDADAGGDTMTGDAELVAVELQQVA